MGESGSGKSVTALSILRAAHAAQYPLTGQGAIRFDGTNLLELPERRMRELRGRDIAMIFQDPMHSLNPGAERGRTDRRDIAHPSGPVGGGDARKRAIDLLDLVRIPDARTRVNAYPHQLSGGMRQRVMIAIAIACRPRLLIADEPTTALDVTVQAQILELLRDLGRRSACRSY